MRLCADTNANGTTGAIVESNKNNNCGPWTSIMLTSGGTAQTPAPAVTSQSTGVQQTTTMVTQAVTTQVASNPLSTTPSTPTTQSTSATPTTSSSSGLPDLAITSLTGPGTGTAGVPVTLNVSVSNIGSAIAYNFLTAFRIRDVNFNCTGSACANAESNPFTLSAGQTGTVSVTYTFASPGNYTIGPCANANPSGSGLIQESNTSNDCGPVSHIVIGSGSKTSASAITAMQEILNLMKAEVARL